MNPGGILYYNTTWSERVLATGASEFPFALRVSNFLAVSDSPFTLDKARWKSILEQYRIDGRIVFDPANPVAQAKLGQLLSLPGQLDAPKGELESRDSLLKRLKGARLITDDNMGTEWE